MPMWITGDALDRDRKFQILDTEGRIQDEDKVPHLSDKEFVKMYEDMLFARHFDERAISLQRQGRLGTYPPVKGHEAAQIGSTYALEEDDWVSITYRESAVPLARGVNPDDVLRYWRGDEAGNTAFVDENIFPINIVIGSQIPHSTGLGAALKYNSDDSRAVVCHFGDGATSEGDFHVGLNFAGVLNTPSVFFCNNNRWAISVPRERQTASKTLAQKAIGYGFEGIRVDGMDPLAIYNISRKALDKAKSPEKELQRPTLIESIQYRFGAHTTSDDPSVYRDEEQLQRWKQKDPITRFEKFLRRTGRLDDEDKQALQARNEERMTDAIEILEASDGPSPDEMFTNTYAQQTNLLDKQSARLRELIDQHGEERIAGGE
jgi:pyruvate dehydrogenase E1 component alpha subunit